MFRIQDVIRIQFHRTKHFSIWSPGFLLSSPGFSNGGPSASPGFSRVRVFFSGPSPSPVRVSKYAHTEALNHTTAKYPINRVECTVFSAPRGNYSGNQPNIFQGQLPDRIVIGMVDSTAFNGPFKKNPFNFKNYDMTYLGLTVNGEHLPSKPLQMKFGDAEGANYVSAFQTLFAGSNKLFQNEENGITRDEYAKGYTLFVFDLTADLCARDHLQPIKNGNVSLEVQFGTALNLAINIMVLGEFQNLIEIDANRNVLCDFNS